MGKLGTVMRVARGGDWVISKYNEYLYKRDPKREAEVMLDLMEGDRDRRGGWSASAQGSCLRAQQFVFLGMPAKKPEERLMNIFTNGDYVHLRHQAAGLISGYITGAEIPVRMEALRLRGTMDAMLSNKAVLEIKSIHTRGFSEVNTFGAKPEHVYQVQAYMLATGTETSHVVYEDKNTNALKELVVQRDDGKIEEIVTGLNDLNEATDSKQLLPMLRECKNYEGKYRTCPFAPVCESAQWPSAPSKPPIRVTSSSARS